MLAITGQTARPNGLKFFEEPRVPANKIRIIKNSNLFSPKLDF